MKKIIKNNLYLFKYILKYGKSYIPLILISAIFQTIATITEIIGIKYIIDALFIKHNINYLFFIIIIYTLIIITTKLFFSWTNYYFPLISKKISIGMTIERMEASQKLDYKCFDIPKYFDDYTRALNAGESQINILVGSLIASLSNIVTVISVITILAQYSLYFILTAIIDVIFSYFVILRQNKLQYQFEFNNTRLFRKESYFKSICLSPSSQKEDKIYGVINYFKNKYFTVATDIYTVTKKHLLQYNMPVFFQNIFSSLLTASTMLIAVIMIFNSQLTAGEFIATITGTQNLSKQMLSLIIQIPKLIQNARYTENYKNIIEYQPTIEKNKASQNTADKNLCAHKFHKIKFENVSFKYPSCDTYVLKNISFEILPNESIAIVGENGSGKTTITKLLFRLYDPTEGNIYIDDINIKEYSISALRNLFASVFQDYNLYSISVSDNITFGQNTPISKVLKDVNLLSKIEKAPQKIYTEVSRNFDENGIVFSGGESQRLCIARALEKNSDILLLDEPSAALDPVAEHNIINLLMEIKKEKSIILISHRLTMCKVADRILYLENGEITESGSHETLIKNQGYYYRLFNMQAKKFQT